MSAARPYFAFASELKPVPSEPTHCPCGTELEPMRRYAGLCRECVALRARPVVAPTERLRCHLKIVRSLYKQRVGHRERYVEVQCDCGRRRVLKWATWVHKRPLQCNACRLRGIDRRGFEAEYAR